MSGCRWTALSFWSSCDLYGGRCSGAKAGAPYDRPMNLHGGTRLYLVAAFTAIVVACAGDGALRDGFTSRDSAGVKIIESYEPAWAEGEGWRLSEEPLVTIGSADGPAEYSLYRVRGALLLSDRRLLIVNSGTDELRYFDSSGTHLYSVGSDGFGPGEFKDIMGVWSLGDSLVIDDYGQDRVLVLSASGEYGRTVMLERESVRSRSAPAGVFSDRSLLARQHVFPRGPDGFRLVRVDEVFRRFSLDGEALHSVGVFFSAEVNIDASPPDADGVSRSVLGDAPFGRRASTNVFGQHVYYASSETYEIRVFSSTGTLERIIRQPIPNAPVTGSDIEAFKEDFVGDEDSQFAAWKRRRVNDLKFPDTKPAYGSVKVDALNNVWVEEYTWLHDDALGDWTVFDTDGRMLGVVQVPGNGRIVEIAEDYLLGLWATELGVEQVKMYRILKD